MFPQRRRKTTGALMCGAVLAACVLSARAAPGAPAERPKETEEQPAAPPSPAPSVQLGPISTEGGEVPGMKAALEATLPAVGQCVADHGGLDAERGLLEIRFLVRARGRAEGVETPTLRGASQDAGRCVRKLLKDRRVGPPTHEPVGVTARVLLAAKAPRKEPAAAPRQPPSGETEPKPGSEEPPPAEPPASRDGPREAKPPTDRAPERPERSRSSKHRPRPASPSQPSK